VPLLIFVWTLHRLDALSQTQAQVGLGLALGIALLGFQIFRRLMSRMSNLVQALSNVAEHAVRSAQRAAPEVLRAAPEAPRTVPEAPRPAPEAPRPVAPTTTPEARPSVFARPPHSAAQPAPSPPADPAAQPPTAAPPAAPTPAAAAAVSAAPPAPTGKWRSEVAAELTVPGIGEIQEVHDLSRAMALLWMSEATVLKGQRVSVSIMKSPRPVVGVLLDVRDDGLVVEPDGEPAPALLGYGRIAAIDAERPRAES